MNKNGQKGDGVKIHVLATKDALGRSAAEAGAGTICTAIKNDGRASIVIATGASQFEMLETLISLNIDWSCVTVFHLDEYVGIGTDHPASFRNYLQERFIAKIGPLKEFVPVNGDAVDLDAELTKLNDRLRDEKIAVCFAGIGENCHLAFNDPPADFNAKDPYIVVDLDDACRQQQMGEGWFETIADVPERAVSMAIPQILKANKIVIAAPDARKAQAVRAAVEGPVTPDAPSSILQRHPNCDLFLDAASAALLKSTAA